MNKFTSYWLNRTLCDTLREMRALSEKSNILNAKRTLAVMSTLIEEAQIMGNRMEARLEYVREISDLHSERKSLIKEVRILGEIKTSMEETENE